MQSKLSLHSIIRAYPCDPWAYFAMTNKVVASNHPTLLPANDANSRE